MVEKTDGTCRYNAGVACESAAEACKKCGFAPDEHERRVAIIRGERSAEELAPVVHGRWIESTEPLGCRDVFVAVCSACGDTWVIDDECTIDEYAEWHKYCSTCGAKMDQDVQHFVSGVCAGGCLLNYAEPREHCAGCPYNEEESEND
ncbi:MAG: hypothetical protein IIV05_01570 [Ruminococcus sp.]|nr:hypothetical protein [Ruminococcus sp.]